MARSLAEKLGIQSLDGLVVGVTGASRGLGKSMALGFAAAGAHVELLARSEGDLADVKAKCESLGGSACVTKLDVSSPESIHAVIDVIQGRHGQLNGWVNNAGLGPQAIRRDYETPPVALSEVPYELWRKTVDTNLNGTFLCMQKVLPLLLEAGGGSIVNISTSPPTMERRGFMPYGATKAAIQAMTRAFAPELSEQGVRVNTHAPGGVTWSDMVPASFAEAGKYILQPTVMIPAAVYLVSAGSADVTGQCLMGRTWNEEHGFADANDGIGEWAVFLDSSG
ncbi:MAG TPA: SDR family oxidoreductase [Dehalococcoidia bacterium]